VVSRDCVRLAIPDRTTENRGVPGSSPGLAIDERSAETPWDFGGVPSALKSFLERSSVRGRVLVPGCGSGYEVQAFHAAGYDVSPIDFSPAAVDQAKRVLGVLAERIILGDFFTYDFGQRRFDLRAKLGERHRPSQNRSKKINLGEMRASGVRGF